MGRDCNLYDVVVFHWWPLQVHSKVIYTRRRPFVALAVCTVAAESIYVDDAVCVGGRARIDRERYLLLFCATR